MVAAVRRPTIVLERRPAARAATLIGEQLLDRGGGVDLPAARPADDLRHWQRPPTVSGGPAGRSAAPATAGARPRVAPVIAAASVVAAAGAAALALALAARARPIVRIRGLGVARRPVDRARTGRMGPRGAAPAHRRRRLGWLRGRLWPWRCGWPRRRRPTTAPTIRAATGGR